MGCASKDAKNVTLVDLTAPISTPVVKRELPRIEVDVSTLPFYATGPVATMYGKEILAEEFNESLQARVLLYPKTAAQWANSKDFVIRDLINDELLLRTVGAKIDQVSEKEIDAMFADFRKILKKIKGGEAAFYKKTIYTEAKLRKEFALEIAMNGFLSEEYGTEASEAEIKAYYVRHKSSYEPPPEVRASHILIKVRRGAGKKIVAAAKKRAYKIYKVAKKPGADFAKLAKKYSEGPTARKGGDLGFFPARRMVQPFSKVAFRTRKGGISKPVKTQFGWHVIKVFDTKAAGKPASWKVVRKEIAKRLNERKVTIARAQFNTEKIAELNIVKLPENIVDNPDF